MSFSTRLLLCVFCLLPFANAAAHSPASSFVTVDLSGGEAVVVTADLAIADVVQVLPLDADNDARISWGELRAGQGSIYDYVTDATLLERAGARCELVPDPGELALVTYSGTVHVSARFQALCSGAGTELAMQTTLFSDINPDHRVVTRIADVGGVHVQVTSPGSPGFVVDVAEPGSAFTMFREGVVHILGGYDHLLFLLLLILPTIAMQNLRQRLWRLFGIVTSFTVAHSITLALAALGYVSLPGRWVEIAIAGSIVIAGAINVMRPQNRIGWQLAFGFGLLHGFGFAGALAELGLGGENLLLQLFAFNAGVEIGQIGVVLLALPIILLLTLLPRYREVLVPLMSAGGAGMGVLWVAARI